MANQQEKNTQAQVDADQQTAAEKLAAARASEAERMAAEQATANALRSAALEAEIAGDRPPYRVVPGGSVATLRGIVDGGNGSGKAGDEPKGVWPRDFHGGETAIKDLLARGAIAKN